MEFNYDGTNYKVEVLDDKHILVGKENETKKVQFQTRNRKDYALDVLEEMVSDEFEEYIDGVVTHATFEYVLDITYADEKTENRSLETWTFDEKRFFETDEPLS